jgi:hypothetical protein
MKKPLVAAVLVLLIGVTALIGTVQSQQKPARAVPVKAPVRNVDAFDDVGSERFGDSTASLDDDVRKLHDRLKQRISGQGKGDEPVAQREVELEVALAKYLADGEITKVISVLEKILISAPGSSEAEKAAAAIQVLKSGTQPIRTAPATPINPKGDAAPQRPGPRPSESDELN